MTFWIAWYTFCHHNRYHRTTLLYSLTAFQQALRREVVGPTHHRERLESSKPWSGSRICPHSITPVGQWSPTFSIHQDHLDNWLKLGLLGTTYRVCDSASLGFIIFSKISHDSHAASPGIISWEALLQTNSVTTRSIYYLYLHFFLPPFLLLSSLFS